MNPEPIPAGIRHFILTQVDSIAHMEAWSMLWREPDATWTADQVAGRLYIAPAEAARVLERLVSQGLAQRRGKGYGWGPASEALARQADELARLYASHLIPVTNLIHAKRDNRIQEFADAFKLRKKGDRT
ncbi:hypothetical protein [Eleftheria terrae]|uniref:hypothetical protein n=1 Tax=Eleftheria terrae TaxID=1597781 RepID=UPI00263B3FCE|nr:hypothetical protein [Eleftheria terrae]WKB53106.1 hypothetical protein N7L95_01485 [Eleftheria terrae]